MINLGSCKKSNRSLRQQKEDSTNPEEMGSRKTEHIVGNLVFLVFHTFFVYFSFIVSEPI
jgi:hypothetical protein